MGIVEGMRVAHSPFYTVAEVANLMRVSRMTVYRMIERGDLPAVRFGRSYRVPEAALQSAIEDGAADSQAG